MNSKNASWLDTSAVLALLRAEPGFEIVRSLIAEATRGRRTVHLAQISLTEIASSVCRDFDEATAREDIRLLGELPIIIEPPTDKQCVEAGLLRRGIKISTADAIVATQAMALDVELVHKDPEFDCVTGLKHRRLPYKQTSSRKR